MNNIPFHPLSLNDRTLILEYTRTTECRNCDLNFMNLMSWRFLYNTEMAIKDGWLVLRFYADGHLAYLVPVGNGEWHDILVWMMKDARALGHPFLLMGVCQGSVTKLEDAFPNFFHFSFDRNYCDYVYNRESLASLAGKKLQSKRNFVNRFMKAHSDYLFRELKLEDIPLCRQLEQQWKMDRPVNSSRHNYDNERRSMDYVFDNWEALGARGGVLFVDGVLVAFTFGGAINYDTFDVCVEKANNEVEGAYAVINKEFVSSLPEQFIYVNREEDLGIDGLRKAKLSYKPAFLLEKNAVRLLHPLDEENSPIV